LQNANVDNFVDELVSLLPKSDVVPDTEILGERGLANTANGTPTLPRILFESSSLANADNNKDGTVSAYAGGGAFSQLLYIPQKNATTTKIWN
jgi:hypothetical protein